MAREVKPQGFLLTPQPFLLTEGAHCRKPRRGSGRFQAAKEIPHARGIVAERLLRGLQRLIQLRQQCASMGRTRLRLKREGIEGPGANKRLKHALPQAPGVHPATEIEKILIGACFAPACDDSLDRPFPHALNGPKPVDNFPFSGGLKAVSPVIHIRRPQGKTHLPGLLNKHDDLVRVLHVGGHHRRHEGGGIVML